MQILHIFEFLKVIGRAVGNQKTKKKKKFGCEVCGKTFQRRHDLKGHKIAIHLKLKNFKCSICSEYFSFERSLRRHKKVHEKKKPYSCPDFDFAFATKNQTVKSLILHSLTLIFQ